MPDAARGLEERAEQMPLTATPMTEIRFGTGSSQLTVASRAALDGLIASLRDRRSGVYLEVRGHADARGSWTFNRRLAARRAEAVRGYLHRSGGIELASIGIAVLSESVQVAEDDTPEGRARNRRVVVVALHALQ